MEVPVARYSCTIYMHLRWLHVRHCGLLMSLEREHVGMSDPRQCEFYKFDGAIVRTPRKAGTGNRMGMGMGNGTGMGWELGMGTEALSRDYHAAHCDFICQQFITKNVFIFTGHACNSSIGTFVIMSALRTQVKVIWEIFNLI